MCCYKDEYCHWMFRNVFLIIVGLITLVFSACGLESSNWSNYVYTVRRSYYSSSNYKRGFSIIYMSLNKIGAALAVTFWWTVFEWGLTLVLWIIFLPIFCCGKYNSMKPFLVRTLPIVELCRGKIEVNDPSPPFDITCCPKCCKTDSKVDRQSKIGGSAFGTCAGLVFIGIGIGLLASGGSSAPAGIGPMVVGILFCCCVNCFLWVANSEDD